MDIALLRPESNNSLYPGYFRSLPGFGRYAVLGSDESGVFNLQISNASLGDEAVYECQVSDDMMRMMMMRMMMMVMKTMMMITIMVMI